MQTLRAIFDALEPLPYYNLEITRMVMRGKMAAFDALRGKPTSITIKQCIDIDDGDLAQFGNALSFLAMNRATVLESIETIAIVQSPRNALTADGVSALLDQFESAPIAAHLRLQNLVIHFAMTLADYQRSDEVYERMERYQL